MAAPEPDLPPPVPMPEKSGPPPVPAGKPGVNPGLVIGAGVVALVLLLAAAWWFFGQKREQAPVPPVEVPAPVAPAAVPEPPPPAVLPVPPEPVPDAAAQKAVPEEAPPPPVKETPKPKPKPKPEAAKRSEPDASSEVRVYRRPADEPPIWVLNLRLDLERCGNNLFCRERVRWRYCDGRWGSVPECAVRRGAGEP